MGDTAAASLTIYNVGGKEPAVAKVLNDFGFSLDWEGGGTSVEEVEHGVTYCYADATIGVLLYLGTQLQELGVSYWGYQESRYEFSGETRAYTPDLGTFLAFASQDGEPLIAAIAIRGFLDAIKEEVAAADPNVADDLAERLVELDRLAGGPWERAFKKLAEHAKSLAS